MTTFLIALSCWGSAVVLGTAVMAVAIYTAPEGKRGVHF